MIMIIVTLKRQFALQNNNLYNDRISFRYLDGFKLNDEKIIELQEESISNMDKEKY